MAFIDRFSDEKYQRRNWEHLQKRIKYNVRSLIPSPYFNPTYLQTLTQISESITRRSSSLLTLNQNLIRGRAVFCNACFEYYQRHDHAAAYASLVAVLNSKHPQIGHLLLRRLVFNIKEAHNSHNYATLTLLTNFLAHLVNQRVCVESLGFELVHLLLYSSADSPIDEVVTIAVEFVQQCGHSLRKANADTLDSVLDRLRELLWERRNSTLYHDIDDEDSRVEDIIKTIGSLRMAEFRDVIRVIPELDLVSDKERVTHVDTSISLYNKSIDTEKELDVFSYDPEFFDANMADISTKIESIIMSNYLGVDIDNNSNAAGAEDDLRNKLPRVELGFYMENVTSEICWKILECCVQQQDYQPYFGELGRRMMMSVVGAVTYLTGFKYAWRDCFVEVYDKIEELETKKVEIVARLFGDLMLPLVDRRRDTKVTTLGLMLETMWARRTYGIPWEYVLGNLRLGDKTRSEAARKFIEVLFHRLLDDAEIGGDLYTKLVKIIYGESDLNKLRIWIDLFESIGLFEFAEYAKNEFAALLVKSM